MKDREIICKYYTYAGGPCAKRGIEVKFREACQRCKKYDPIPGGRPARTDNRKEKINKILKREEKEY